MKFAKSFAKFLSLLILVVAIFEREFDLPGRFAR